MFEGLWILLALVEISDQKAERALGVAAGTVVRWKKGAAPMPPQYQVLLFWLCEDAAREAERFYLRPDAAALVTARAAETGMPLSKKWREKAVEMVRQVRARVDAERVRIGALPDGARQTARDMARRWGWRLGEVEGMRPAAS